MSIKSADTPSFTGSSILGESPPFRSHTGLGGADLSLSELYVSDNSERSPPARPFSLLPQRDKDEKDLDEDEGFDAEGQVEDEQPEGDVTVANARNSATTARTREERLLHDLFVLKKLNSSFSAYNDALQDTMSGTQNVAVQLDRTERLLDQYVSLLQHTEKNSKLIFDKTWEGGGTDQVILEKIQIEAEHQAQREREERERATQLEHERQQREEEDRKTKQAKEEREREGRGSKSVRGVIRGVRGIKTRGSERGQPISARGRMQSTSTAQVKRGISSMTGRGARNG